MPRRARNGISNDHLHQTTLTLFFKSRSFKQNDIKKNAAKSNYCDVEFIQSYTQEEPKNKIEKLPSPEKRRKVNLATNTEESINRDLPSTQLTQTSHDLTVNKSKINSETTHKLKPRILQQEPDESCSGSVSDCDLDETIIYDVEEVINATGNLSELWETGAFWNLKCFLKIHSFVSSRQHFISLLSVEDKDILSVFLGLPKECQQICLKLYVHLPKWYSIHPFCKKIALEVSEDEVDKLYEQLKKKKCVLTDYTSEEPVELLNILTKPEVVKICNAFKLKKKALKKEVLITSLLKHCNGQTTLTPVKSSAELLKNKIKEVMGLSVKLSKSLHNMFYRMHLLYSFATQLTRNGDLYLLMGQIENASILLPTFGIQDAEIFKDSCSFLAYSLAHEYYAEFSSAFEKKDKDTMQSIARIAYSNLNAIYNDDGTSESCTKRMSAEYIYSKILRLASQHLTQNCDPNVIIEWLELIRNVRCLRGGFYYDQMAMIQCKYLKLHQEAAKTIIKGLNDDDLSAIDLSILKIRGTRLAKSRKNKLPDTLKEQIINKTKNIKLPDRKAFPKIDIDAAAIQGSNESGYKRVYVIRREYDTTYSSVEQVAIHHYKNQNYTQGMHCEGSLITTLFCVCFWDVIYTEEVPGVFLTEIQYIPFDFYTTDFYKSRKPLVDRRLKEISADWSIETLLDFMKRIWDLHSLEKCLIILNMSFEELYAIFSCIGRTRMAHIFERLVVNFKEFHSGMPDLFVWNPQSLKCKFVEVKGEKDTLSMKQKFWLDYLRSAGLDVEVCHVHTISSRPRERNNAHNFLLLSMEEEESD